MKIQINITEEVLMESANCPVRDPEYGFPFGAHQEVVTNCAVAVAVRQIFPKAKVYGAWMDPLGLIDDVMRPTNLLIYFPSKAADFINLFDLLDPINRMNMKPFSFEIEVHQAVLDKINIAEVEEVLKTSKTLSLV